LVLLLAMGLNGCSAASGGPAGAAPAASAPQSAVADSFRSSRSHPTVPLPIRVRVPVIGVDSALESLGRAADGTMALPSRPELAGWFSGGARPGQPGPAVVIGHVDWGHRPAVFFRLRELSAGDIVYIDRADGSTARFRVTNKTLVRKSSFPTDEVFAPTLQPALRLVTCGGSFDYATRNYRDNVIVFAVPS